MAQVLLSHMCQVSDLRLQREGDAHTSAADALALTHMMRPYHCWPERACWKSCMQWSFPPGRQQEYYIHAVSLECMTRHPPVTQFSAACSAVQVIDSLTCCVQAVRVECPVVCQVACPAACPTWAEQAHQQAVPQAALDLRLRRSTKCVTPDRAPGPISRMGQH